MEINQTPDDARKYISALQTRITYLRACTSKLENEILRFELKLCSFEEFQEAVENTLKNVKQEIQ
jgi:hypothetical protein